MISENYWVVVATITPVLALTIAVETQTFARAAKEYRDKLELQRFIFAVAHTLWLIGAVVNITLSLTALRGQSVPGWAPTATTHILVIGAIIALLSPAMRLLFTSTGGIRIHAALSSFYRKPKALLEYYALLRKLDGTVREDVTERQKLTDDYVKLCALQRTVAATARLHPTPAHVQEAAHVNDLIALHEQQLSVPTARQRQEAIAREHREMLKNHGFGPTFERMKRSHAEDRW